MVLVWSNKPAPKSKKCIFTSYSYNAAFLPPFEPWPRASSFGHQTSASHHLIFHSRTQPQLAATFCSEPSLMRSSTKSPAAPPSCRSSVRLPRAQVEKASASRRAPQSWTPCPEATRADRGGAGAANLSAQTINDTIYMQTVTGDFLNVRWR